MLLTEKQAIGSKTENNVCVVCGYAPHTHHNVKSHPVFFSMGKPQGERGLTFNNLLHDKNKKCSNIKLANILHSCKSPVATAK